MAWSEAESPVLGVTPIMDWLRTEFGKDYKPNTRETVRRQTLHQFVAAALVVLNPDDPERATNSPRSCYQIAPTALTLLRTFGTKEFDTELRGYLDEVPGLQALYDEARQLHRIPVTLQDGSLVTLSPGGQNILIKEMIEDFCGLFTPGGHVLYVETQTING